MTELYIIFFTTLFFALREDFLEGYYEKDKLC